MGNKQQTAVEWLIEQLEQHHVKIDIKNTVVYQQAKAMEKKQIINGWDNGFLDYQISMHEDAEQYYIDTYGE
jgi:hypothetical protein